MSERGRSGRSPDAEALAEVLAERARESAEAGLDPPEAEVLLDYMEGRLSPEDEAAVARRLVASPEATRDLLDLAELAAAGEGAEALEEPRQAPADLGVRAAWTDFAHRRETAAASAPAADGRLARFAPQIAALAAGLLVAVIGLGVWVGQLRTSGGGADDGPAATGVATLELYESLRSGAPPMADPAAGEPVLLVLLPPKRCPRYRAEISRSDGGGATAVVDLAPSGASGLLNVLYRGAPGIHVLRLLGCEPKNEISRYRFEIARPAAVTPGRNAEREQRP